MVTTSLLPLIMCGYRLLDQNTASPGVAPLSRGHARQPLLQANSSLSGPDRKGMETISLTLRAPAKHRWRAPSPTRTVPERLPYAISLQRSCAWGMLYVCLEGRLVKLRASQSAREGAEEAASRFGLSVFGSQETWFCHSLAV